MHNLKKKKKIPGCECDSYLVLDVGERKGNTAGKKPGIRPACYHSATHGSAFMLN